MPCVNCVERCKYDKVVTERDDLKHANICLKAAYENEHRLAQKYFEQAAELQRDSDIAESNYRKVVNTQEARDAELNELREKYESMSNKYAKAYTDNGINLYTSNARIAKVREENIKLCEELNKVKTRLAWLDEVQASLKEAYAEIDRLRIENDNITRANSSLRAERDEICEQIKSLRAERDKDYEDPQP